MKITKIFESFIKEENEEEPLSQPSSVYADRLKKTRDAYEDGWDEFVNNFINKKIGNG